MPRDAFSLKIANRVGSKLQELGTDADEVLLDMDDGFLSFMIEQLLWACEVPAELVEMVTDTNPKEVFIRLSTFKGLNIPLMIVFGSGMFNLGRMYEREESMAFLEGDDDAIPEKSG